MTDVATYGADGLAADVLRRLQAKDLWLACAESCTGGLVASRLTSVPGSSRAFRGGVVCYHPDVKVDVLGVDAEAVVRNEAVNEDVAKALAAGARRVLRADYGIGVTGFADPSKEGLVFLGLARPDGRVEARERRYGGGRNAVREQAAAEALEWLQGIL